MPYARTLVVLVIVALVSAGCGKRSQPVPVPEPASAVRENPPPPVTDAPPDAAPAAGLTEEEIFARKTLDALNAERPLVDVFFDFDQWSVRDDARPTLQKNADWLRRWSSTRATIEGHCDSRGTSEYNLALADRRAHAVRDYLVSLGISPERLLVVSKGEEAPFCENDTEDCWQENRRAHFVITAK